MTRKKAARDKAIFRFLVISKVRALTSRGIAMAKAIKIVAEEKHFDTKMACCSVSERSIYRWLGSYNHMSFDGLFDLEKGQIEFSNTLPPKLADFLKKQKADDSAVSTPEMIRRAEKTGLLQECDQVSRTSVWRACHRLDLPMTRKGLLQHRDMRRFSYRHRMQMVLCDGKHFKVGPNRTKRVAIIFLDDATRFGLDAVVGPSESTELFLKGLCKVIKRHGRMVCLYMDNGSGFTSDDAKEVCASLGITVIYGEAGYPEGHGKIERFNRTLKGDLLRHWDGKEGIDTSCSSLTLRIQTYLREDYGRRLHEGLDGIPEEAFLGDSRPLDFPPSVESLERHFILRETRMVSKDNVVSLAGTAYEMPLGYAGSRQEIKHCLLEQSYLFLHEGKLIKLDPVELSKNASLRRQKNSPPEAEDSPPGTEEKSSASMTFDDHFSPIIDSDGGYQYKE